MQDGSNDKFEVTLYMRHNSEAHIRGVNSICFSNQHLTDIAA